MFELLRSNLTIYSVRQEGQFVINLIVFPLWLFFDRYLICLNFLNLTAMIISLMNIWCMRIWSITWNQFKFNYLAKKFHMNSSSPLTYSVVWGSSNLKFHSITLLLIFLLKNLLKRFPFKSAKKPFNRDTQICWPFELKSSKKKIKSRSQSLKWENLNCIHINRNNKQW